MAKRRSTSRAITVSRPTVVVRERISRRSRSSRGTRGFKLPLALVAGLYPGANRFWAWVSIGQYSNGFQHLVAQYTGYHPWDKKWSTDEMKDGLFPLLVGLLVHQVANQVGINRWLDKARVPIVRI